MIRAPVRVRVAASRVSCKQCGREYATGELATLTLCESCGTELVRGNVVVEAIQQVISAQRPAVKDHPFATDAIDLAARISVKRFEILPGAGNTRRDSNHPALVGRVPAAAWFKVA